MKTALLIFTLLLLAGCTEKPSLKEHLTADVATFKELPTITQVVILLDWPITLLTGAFMVFACTGFEIRSESTKAKKKSEG